MDTITLRRAPAEYPRWYLLYDELVERDYRPEPLDLGIDADILIEEEAS